MQPILWLCRLALWMVTATAFVFFSFYGLASCSRKHVSVPPAPPSAEEVAKVDAVRELHPDFASSPRVAIDVDYAEGADARWWPRGEAPVLQNLVAEGLLPPVAERVGAQPLVLHGADGIGAYGGTWNRVSSSNSDVGIISWRLAATTLVRWSPLGFPLVPNLATEWEIREGGREYIFHLRRGVRWSDGHPLTSADFLFWWEGEIEYFKAHPQWMKSGNTPGTLTAPDAYTLVFTFPEPKGTFLEELASRSELPMPAHYLRRFHPNYGDPVELKEWMQRLQVRTPMAVYTRMKDIFNPEHPRLWPWVYRSYSANPPFVFVRNPYYWAVDAEGNQLPYIDRVAFQVREANMIGISATQGRLTFQLRQIRYEDYTLLMTEQERGDYRVLHWYPGSRSNFTLFPNLNRRIDPQSPATRHKHRLLNEKNFRIALSLAINRPQIIEAEYNGQVEPAQLDPGPDSPFHLPALYHAHTRYDPEQANRLLDELGLTRRDREGFRTYPDGARMVFYIHTSDYTGTGPSELIIEDWAAVGIRAALKAQARTLFQTQQAAFEHDFTVWSGESEFIPLLEPRNFVPVNISSFFAPGYGIWYQQGGMHGALDDAGPGTLEPPPDHPLRRSMEIYEQVLRETNPQRQVEQFKEILAIAAENLWTINIASPSPQVVIAARNLRNVPATAIVGWRFQTPSNAGIETWWLSDPRESPGMESALREQMLNVSVNPRLLVQPDPGNGVGATIGDWTCRLLRWAFLATLGLLVLMIAVRHPYVGKRLTIMVPTLLVISIITFTIIQMPPGDYLTSRIQELEMTGDEAAINEIRNLQSLFYLDDPVVVRYLRWVGVTWFGSFQAADRGLLQGNLGRSMENGLPVNEIVGDRITLTVIITFATILFTWLFAIPTGIYSAVRQYSPGDYILTFLGFIGMCIPNFLLALVLIYFAREWFGLQIMGLFSEHYALQPDWTWGKFLDLLAHLWIPVVVLGIGGTAGMIRVMRGNLLDELNKPYVVTARAKGVRPLKLLMKYPVRIALSPFISGIGALFPQIVSGGAIVAMVLALPMVGPLMLSALMTQDMYVAGSMLMVLSVLSVFGTLVSDLLLLLLDPRIRMEGK